MSKFLNVYWMVLTITGLLAILFENDRKKFVISTAIVHIFVCGCRYDVMHGDLMAYKRQFESVAAVKWTSNEIISNGRNTLFYALNKFVANATNNNFQVLLFIIATISIVSISILIYKYSEMPFISYLLWSCFGFYIFGFYSIKQSLAMAFVMFAASGIFERNRLKFYIFEIIAGFIHLPAFVFLPAYELCRARRIRAIISFYVILVVLVLLFRNRIVALMTDIYYEGKTFAEVSSYGVGGKSLMIVGLAVIGVFMCNIKNDIFRCNLIICATASIIQMFAVYNNVFTRLADYYFQFIILYAPFILSQPHSNKTDSPILLFDKNSKLLITVVFCMLALVFYYHGNFMHVNDVSVDNLVENFKFFWQ